MIDAGPSLRAAEGVSAPALLTYLVNRGWSVRPSRVDGISILTKHIRGADWPVEFILPVKPGFADETRRIADALRTIAAVERRPVASIASGIRRNLRSGQPGKAETVSHERGLSLTLFYAFVEYRKRQAEAGRPFQLPNALPESLQRKIVHYSAQIGCDPGVFYEALLDFTFASERYTEEELQSMMEQEELSMEKEELITKYNFDTIKDKGVIFQLVTAAREVVNNTF